MLRSIVPLLALVSFAAGIARAETVEVAKDVAVTRKTYAAPFNEQPFYGFIDKTPEQRSIDERFVASIIGITGSREKAFENANERGWFMVSKGNFADAAKRFNQAFVISPEKSAVYHGLAVIAVARFNDIDFADELFKIALKQPDPMRTLKADYGRFLLIAKLPKEALPVLEKAVIDAENFPDAWSNLALARFENGDAQGACAAAAESERRKPSKNVLNDLRYLRQKASCN